MATTIKASKSNSSERILLHNKNVDTHPQLADMLSEYTIAIANGYIPSAEVISALSVLSPTDPAALAALTALRAQLHTSGFTDAAPVNTVVGPQTVAEDTNLSIIGLSVSDADDGNTSITTTLSVAHGTLTVLAVAGGAVVASSGTDTVTLTGTPSQINATLAAANNVVYRGAQNYFGPDALTMTTNDGFTGSGGPRIDTDTVALTVTAVNDAPTVTAPVTLAPIAEDSGARLITQAELLANASDVDSPSLSAINLAMSSGNGVLVNNGDGTWSYTPALNDDTAVTFSYQVTDGSLSAVGSATLDIECNNPLPGGSFLPRVTYEIGSITTTIAIGDLNGDGKPDLAVADYGSNTVSVLLGNGDGTFQDQVPYATGGLGPFSVAIGDLNGDGRPDLALAHFNSDTVSVLLGNGDGTFQAQATYAAGAGAYFVAIRDFNGDGSPDLAVANAHSSNVSVLLGNGDGTFQAQATYATGSTPVSVAIDDLNGDGSWDLAVANNLSNTVSVLLGNGDGTFQDQATYATDARSYSVAIGDLNNDGKLDLAVPNLGPSTVSVLLGNGDGTFQDQVPYATGGLGPISVAIDDLNGDGKPDLAVANYFSGSVSVLLGNGDGTFQTQATYATGVYTISVAVGDLNGDCRPDIAVADAGSSTISVLLNSPPTDFFLI